MVFVFIGLKNCTMKRDTKIVLGLAAIATVALIAYGAKNRSRRRMLTKVSDEGYETAHDVLFPQRSTVGKKLHLGPIIPAL